MSALIFPNVRREAEFTATAPLPAGFRSVVQAEYKAEFRDEDGPIQRAHFLRFYFKKLFKDLKKLEETDFAAAIRMEFNALRWAYAMMEAIVSLDKRNTRR
ncbi:hypothetical protein [Acidaminococcus intestini]|uniref:hypothetical protein n=1 Tax=Acidaminococcus intestini TaxID=187327 RepID=UPI00307F3FBD